MGSADRNKLNKKQEIRKFPYPVQAVRAQDQENLTSLRTVDPKTFYTLFGCSNH